MGNNVWGLVGSNTITVDLGGGEVVSVDIQGYSEIRKSLVEEMTELPSMYAYIYTLKARAQERLGELKNALKAFEGDKKKDHRERIVESKGKVTISEVDASVDSDQEVIVEREYVDKYNSIVTILGGILSALSIKKSMLKQLAAHERYSLSMYSNNEGE